MEHHLLAEWGRGLLETLLGDWRNHCVPCEAGDPGSRDPVETVQLVADSGSLVTDVSDTAAVRGDPGVMCEAGDPGEGHEAVDFGGQREAGDPGGGREAGDSGEGREAGDPGGQREAVRVVPVVLSSLLLAGPWRLVAPASSHRLSEGLCTC